MAKGGHGGSGVFGLIGTTVQCDADNNSTYCQFAKLMNILTWLIILAILGYLGLQFLKKK